MVINILQFCQRLGWKGDYGNWDHLPLVLSVDGEPKLYELPKELISNVKITHPRYFVIISFTG
jgi:nitric-oxide synthase